MRLNLDCVRDIMFYLEENLEYGGFVGFPTFDTVLNDKYSDDEIMHSVGQLAERGYIKNSQTDCIFIIRDIMPSGYEFLDNTRETRVWEQIKIAAKGKDLNAALGIAKNLSAKFIGKKIEDFTGTDIF